MPKEPKQKNSVVGIYLEELETKKQYNSKYIFRGQSDADWGIESTYQRRIKNSGNKDSDFSKDNFLKYHEETLIKPFKERKYGEDKDLTDLQILQELQHYGTATGLIDFSLDFLIALWFACNSNLKADKTRKGKVFLFDINQEGIKTNEGLELDKIDDNTIYYFIEEEYKINNRISSQKGVFLLSINPIQKSADIEIDAEHKKQILDELKTNFNISEETLFPDIFGFAYLNNVHRPIITKSAQSYFDDGNEYFRKDKYKEAIADYSEAIKIESDFYQAYHNRGSAYAMLKQYKDAIANFSEALEIESQKYGADYKSSEMYTQLKQYVENMEHIAAQKPKLLTPEYKQFIKNLKDLLEI